MILQKIWYTTFTPDSGLEAIPITIDTNIARNLSAYLMSRSQNMVIIRTPLQLILYDTDDKTFRLINSPEDARFAAACIMNGSCYVFVQSILPSATRLLRYRLDGDGSAETVFSTLTGISDHKLLENRSPLHIHFLYSNEADNRLYFMVTPYSGAFSRDGIWFFNPDTAEQDRVVSVNDRRQPHRAVFYSHGSFSCEDDGVIYFNIAGSAQNDDDYKSHYTIFCTYDTNTKTSKAIAGAAFEHLAQLYDLESPWGEENTAIGRFLLHGGRIWISGIPKWIWFQHSKLSDYMACVDLENYERTPLLIAPQSLAFMADSKSPGIYSAGVKGIWKITPKTR